MTWLGALLTSAAIVASGEPAASPLSAPAEERTVIVAGRMVAPDGSLVEDVAIIIDRGKIAAIGKASETGDGPNVVRFPNSVLSPGLIDLGSTSLIWAANREQGFPIDPAVDVTDAIDSGHSTRAAFRAAGITAAMLIPSPTKTVAGASATVRPWTADGSVETMRSPGSLVMALGPATWVFGSEPTSRSGALQILREALDNAKQGKGEPRLAEWTQGKRDALIVCEAAEDVYAALNLMTRYGGSGAIAHTADLFDVAQTLGEANATVIVGPFTFSTDTRQLMAPGLLDAAGGEVAFASGSPVGDPHQLRATAALAVRHGMDPAAARRALTVTAARIAGVLDRVGRIEVGAEADLVIFSGDPLRLDSRVEAVWVKGSHLTPPLDPHAPDDEAVFKLE